MDYFSKLCLAAPVSGTQTARDAIAAVKAAMVVAEELLGRPLIEDCTDPATGEICPVTIVSDNGPGLQVHGLPAVHPLPTRARPHPDPTSRPGDPPRCIPHRTSPGLEDEIVALRKELCDLGVDAGAATIQYHLGLRHATVPSVSTIWRVLRRRGFVTPQPHKHPRSSWVRFEARLPNECWQSDVTHWRLADDTEVDIVNVIDDHSRLVVGSRVVRALSNDSSGRVSPADACTVCRKGRFWT